MSKIRCVENYFFYITLSTINILFLKIEEEEEEENENLQVMPTYSWSKLSSYIAICLGHISVSLESLIVYIHYRKRYLEEILFNFRIGRCDITVNINI